MDLTYPLDLVSAYGFEFSDWTVALDVPAIIEQQSFITRPRESGNVYAVVDPTDVLGHSQQQNSLILGRLQPQIP